MASLELRKRYLGEGYVGSVEVAPALSWSDRRALEGAAAGALQSAVELRSLNRSIISVEQALEGLAMSNAGVTAAIGRLEGELGLRLDEQTQILEAQLDLLTRIDEALRTPARTRAAERISQAGELLRRRRWQRALELGKQAIEDDPNNAAAFRTVAWAALGLKQLDTAREHFIESAEADDGDGRAQAVRQAARLALATSGPDAALVLLERANDDRVSLLERRAIDYDAAVYLAQAGRLDQACAALNRACASDDRFCLLALHDELVGEYPSLKKIAAERLTEITDALRARRQQIVGMLDEAAQRLAGLASTADRFGRRHQCERLLEHVEKRCTELANLTADKSPTLQATLVSLGDLSERIEELSDPVQRLDEELRALEAAAREEARRREARMRALEEAINTLTSREGATIVARGEGHATLVRRRRLRQDLWSIQVGDDAQINIRKH